MKFSTLLLTSVLFASPVHAFADDAPHMRVITVTGEAKQKVRPDIAMFSTTLEERALSQAEAKGKLDKKMHAWLALASDFDIKNEDRQTGYVGLSRSYDWENGHQRFIGYVAQANLSMKLRDMDRVASLQDELSKSGFESVQGPNYALEDRSDQKNAVLKDALLNAQNKAQELAQSLGESLGKPTQITEGYAQVNSPQPVYAMQAMAKAEGVGSPPEMPSGVIEVQAQVSATFELLDR